MATARAAPNGTTVVVEAVLTVPLGSLEDGKGGFIEDATGGIALLLPATLSETLPAGTIIRATGSVDDRYAQRTIRLHEPPVVIGTGDVPRALPIATGGAGEELEGRFVTTTGVVSETPSALTSGFSLLVDDGTGPLRVVVVTSTA